MQRDIKLKQYLARYQYLGGINVVGTMDRVKAAVEQDYRSRTLVA